MAERRFLQEARSDDRDAPHNLYLMVDKMVDHYYGEHTAALRERFGFTEGVQYDAGEPFTSVSLTYQSTYNPAHNHTYTHNPRA